MAHDAYSDAVMNKYDSRRAGKLRDGENGAKPDGAGCGGDLSRMRAGTAREGVRTQLAQKNAGVRAAANGGRHAGAISIPQVVQANRRRFFISVNASGMNATTKAASDHMGSVRPRIGG